MNQSEIKTQIELSNKEKRDLMILSNLDKDKVLLSYIKGEQNHPEDKIINLKINIKCLIITFSRKVNNPEEVSTNLKFYRDIYNKKLKEELKNTNISKIINSMSIDEIKHVLNEENKLDSDNEEDDHRLNHQPKTSLLYNNKNKTRMIINQNFPSTDGLLRLNSQFIEKDSNVISVEKSIRSNVQSPSNKYQIYSNPKARVNDEMSDSDSVDYMDRLIIDDKSSEGKEAVFRKKYNYTKSSSNKKEKDLIDYFIKDKTKIQSSFSRNSLGQTKIAYRKSIFSIVIGNIKVNHLVHRDDKLSLTVEVNSFTFFDHNLTFSILNSCIPLIMNIKDNSFDELHHSKGKKTDYVSLVFNILYYEKNLEIQPEVMKDLLPKRLALFLLETLQSFINKNRNFFFDVFGVFDSIINTDSKFLNDYFYKYGLKK